jgi:hypothetical protein
LIKHLDAGFVPLSLRVSFELCEILTVSDGAFQATAKAVCFRDGRHGNLFLAVQPIPAFKHSPSAFAPAAFAFCLGEGFLRLRGQVSDRFK